MPEEPDDGGAAAPLQPLRIFTWDGMKMKSTWGLHKWAVALNHPFEWDFPFYTIHFGVPPFTDTPR